MHAPALAAPVPSSYALSDGVTSATFAIDATVGPRLVSIGDAREPAAHGFASDVGLWSVRLWNGNDIDISAAQAQCATRTISQSGSGAAALLTLSWGDCASSKLDSTDRFDVTIKAKLGADHALAMTIDVTTRIPNKVLRAVEFPRLSINSRGAVKDQVLSYPQVGGWLLKKSDLS